MLVQQMAAVASAMPMGGAVRGGGARGVGRPGGAAPAGGAALRPAHRRHEADQPRSDPGDSSTTPYIYIYITHSNSTNDIIIPT